jgi:hypothetical protein
MSKRNLREIKQLSRSDLYELRKEIQSDPRLKDVQKIRITITPPLDDEFIGDKTVTYELRCDNSEILKDTIAELEHFNRTGEPPRIFSSLINSTQHIPPPIKRGSKVEHQISKQFIYLPSNIPDKVMNDLEIFKEKIRGYAKYDGVRLNDLTQEQKYSLIIRQSWISDYALGLFYRLIGGIPDVLSLPEIRQRPFMNQMFLRLEVDAAFYELVKAGYSQIKRFSTKQDRNFLFKCPLDLFLETIKEGLQDGHDYILVGDKKFKSKKVIRNEFADFKRFFNGDYDDLPEYDEHKQGFLEGEWYGLILLALKPLRHDRKQQQFKRLWGNYLAARQKLLDWELCQDQNQWNKKGELLVIGGHNRHKRVRFGWEGPRAIFRIEK